MAFIREATLCLLSLLNFRGCYFRSVRYFCKNSHGDMGRDAEKEKTREMTKTERERKVLYLKRVFGRGQAGVRKQKSENERRKKKESRKKRVLSWGAGCGCWICSRKGTPKTQSTRWYRSYFHCQSFSLSLAFAESLVNLLGFFCI